MLNKSIHRSDFAESLINSGYLFLFMLVFSVIGVFFMFANMDDWLEFIIGMAFTIPIMMIYFYTGGQEGTREFKKLNGFSVDRAKSGGVIVPNVFKGLLYVVPYALVSIVFAALCWLIDNQVLKVLLLIVFMPAAMLGQSAGLIDYPHEVVYDKGLETEYKVLEGTTSGANVFIVILVFVLVACIIFWIAYIIKINKSKSSFNSFLTEIVDNDKFRK